MGRSDSACMAGKRTPSLLIRILLSLLLAIGLVPASAVFGADKAYAATTGYLSVGNKIPYGGWGTTRFAVNGNEAYCGNPSKPTPSAGTYTMHETSDIPLLAGLWFGYGGPGFDASMWPSSWYDGSGMTPDRYRALTHIVLSDIYSNDGHYSYGQCNSNFVRWCQDNVVGFSIDDGHLVNENAINVRIRNYGFTLNGAGDSFGDVPKGFTGYTMSTGSNTQVILTFEYHPYGSVEVHKASANTDITNGNGCYTLEGAVFGIYTDPACTNLVRAITCGADGVGRADEILIGSYYLKEITAPRGYALNMDVTGIQVEAEQTTYSDVSDIPQNDPAYMVIQKYDGERTYFAHNLPQGSASLGGAEYRLDYYDGFYKTHDEAKASGAPMRTWTLRTDDDGFAALEQSYVVSGDALYKDTNGNPTLPLGTLVIQEVKAPEGYLLDESTAYVQQITQEGHLETVYTYVMPVHPEQVKRGGVSIEKRDLESGLLTPLGGATLDGTEFKIKNRSKNSVIVDGIDYAPGAVVKTIYTKGGVASTSADALPYGHYSIQETAPSEGYLLTDATERFFDIIDEDVIVKIESDAAPHNQVKRGDLELVKARESDQHRLGNIPFRITSQTTGENHVFVTDINGEAKTEAAWNPHTQRTNANDAAVAADGTVDESKLDPEAGVWFGLTQEGWSVKPNDNLGALPYDTYQVDELRCSGNEGLELVSMTMRITRHGYQIDMGTVDNQPEGQVSLSTTARDGIDGDKSVVKEPDVTVIDRVEYAGVTIGTTYRVEGTLIDKSTEKPILREDGTPVTAEKSFTAESVTGYVELQFTFDATLVEGTKTVAFEKLIDTSTGLAVAAHEDIEDYDQTVSITPPEIGTTATDGLDGDHAVIAGDKATVVDVVSYKGLTPGREYTVKGTLMIVEEGAATPLLDEAGEPITAKAAFTPKDPSGSVEVVFEFDSSLLSGKSIVAYEKVFYAETEIASHEDPDDPSQTVEVVPPEIGTYAFDSVDTDKRVVADVSSKVIDKVTYQNLVPGEQYRAYGFVLAKPSNPDGEDALDDRLAKIKAIFGYDEDGEQALPWTIEDDNIQERIGELASDEDLVWGQASFTPETQSGSIEVPFEFDSASLAGSEFVVIEMLVKEGDGAQRIVADHVDLDSADQSFTVVPSTIGTTARDKSDGDHSVLASKDAVIIDKVCYADLIPGLEYELSGVLMDKQTGKELMVADKPVKASVLFTPNAPAGEIELELAFDSRSGSDHDLVVFEYLTKDGEPVAEHTDIDDEAQTVHVTDPELTRTTTGYYDKTGVDERGLYALLALLGAAGIAAVAFGARKLIRKPADPGNAPESDNDSE